MNDDKNIEAPHEPDDPLWDSYIKDVKPIKRGSVRKIPADTKKKQPDQVIEPPKQPKDALHSVPKSALSPLKPKVRSDGAPQLDRRTAQKLKRGLFPIEDKIDLHGMTQDAACAALQSFVASAYARQLRCVLVVTGKGRLMFDQENEGVFRDIERTHQTRTPGVIKRNFKSWLLEEPYKSMVLKIETAQIKDGGEGAAYILLRRQRG